MAYAYVVERDTKNMVSYSLETRLFQDGIIKIDTEIDSDLANEVQNQLLYLQSTLDPNSSNPADKTIKIYINSPGGSVYDGLGIYDMMQLLIKQGYIIETVNIGMAASMGALLLMAGSKGHRKSFPHSRIMVHELSSVAYGKASSMKDEMKEVEVLQKELDKIMEKHASEELIDLCTRKDYWMSAYEAANHGIIDEVVEIE